MALSFVTIHMTTRLVGRPPQPTTRTPPVAAPTPSIEPTLAPTRPSRPAPFSKAGNIRTSSSTQHARLPSAADLQLKPAATHREKTLGTALELGLTRRAWRVRHIM
eukprot:scaffold653_cov68-Phaeocystis_antarctica.AAC.4